MDEKELAEIRHNLENVIGTPVWKLEDTIKRLLAEVERLQNELEECKGHLEDVLSQTG